VRGFMQQQTGSNVPPPPPPPSPSQTGHSRQPSSSASAGGPSLEDLKKVNLGAEIEALFAELKLIRDSKNSYRDAFNAREKELEDLAKETQKLRESEDSMRKKLHLSEKNVLLLNSENMELQEKAKSAKEYKAVNEKLVQQVSRLQNNDTTPLLKRIEALEHDLQSKAELVRALTRKLDRTRRRDPLLQFSQACSSDVLRLLGSEHQPSTDVEEAFSALQEAFDAAKQQCWDDVVSQEGRGAKLFAASSRQVLAALLSTSAALDAVIMVGGDVEAAKTLFSVTLGYSWTTDPLTPGRVIIASPANCSLPSAVGGALGPFGVAVALRLAAPSLGSHMTFSISSAQAHITRTLAENPHRASITYESCRSGGPGGQAANVSETQLTARLSIDGHFMFQAEAQDSRSAVANKDAATERLLTTKRQAWNDHAPKPTAESLRAELLEKRGSSSSRSTVVDAAVDTNHNSTDMKEFLELATKASSAGNISISDCAVVHAVALLR